MNNIEILTHRCRSTAATQRNGAVKSTGCLLIYMSSVYYHHIPLPTNCCHRGCCVIEFWSKLKFMSLSIQYNFRLPFNACEVPTHLITFNYELFLR